MSIAVVTHLGAFSAVPITGMMRRMKYPNRLREIRMTRGMTHASLAEAVGTIRGQIYKLENGERKLTQDWMTRLAHALNCEPEEFISKSPSRYKVPVIAEVGAGGTVYPIDDLPLMSAGVCESRQDYINCEFVDAPPGYSGGVVAVRVKGDSMLPFMPSGTVVYYEQRITGSCDECLNKLAVVFTADGAAMLKIIERGTEYGRYNLRSYNMSLIENVELEWCAKVIFIKPV